MNINTNTSSAVLREYLRWLSRSGYKYPMVGCPVNVVQLQAAVKDAITLAGLVIPMEHVSSLVKLAELGVSNVGGTGKKKLPCIAFAKRLLRRWPKCQDTENSQTIRRV